MQVDATLIEVPVQYVRMLQSHLPESPPAPKVYLQYIDHYAHLTSTLFNHRLHENDGVILDHVDFRSDVKDDVVELGATLASLGTRVLFWSKHAVPDSVPKGCAFVEGHSRKAASQVVKWLAKLTEHDNSDLITTGYHAGVRLRFLFFKCVSRLESLVKWAKPAGNQAAPVAPS